MQKNHSQLTEKLRALINSFSSDQNRYARAIRIMIRKQGFHGRAAAKKLILKAKVKRNGVRDDVFEQEPECG